MSTIKCVGCGAMTDPLAIFPGKRCLECHKRTPRGRRMVSADELVRMWGGGR